MIRFLPVVLAVVVSACAGSSTTSEYPPLDPSEVVIYASEDDIPGEFEVVSFITPPQQSTYAPAGQAQQQVRDEAARRGANGLLLVEADSEVANARIAAAINQQRSYNRTQYVAIYVFGDTSSTAN